MNVRSRVAAPPSPMIGLLSCHLLQSEVCPLVPIIAETIMIFDNVKAVSDTNKMALDTISTTGRTQIHDNSMRRQRVAHLSLTHTHLRTHTDTMIKAPLTTTDHRPHLRHRRPSHLLHPVQDSLVTTTPDDFRERRQGHRADPQNRQAVAFSETLMTTKFQLESPLPTEASSL